MIPGAQRMDCELAGGGGEEEEREGGSGRGMSEMAAGVQAMAGEEGPRA